MPFCRRQDAGGNIVSTNASLIAGELRVAGVRGLLTCVHK